MITIKELFDGAIEYDLKLVAHSVFWALSENVVRYEDDAERMNEIELNQEAIQELVNKNILGIERIKLFVIRTQIKDLFAFYFAENVLDANSLHQTLFDEKATNIVNGSRLMAKPMHFATPNLNMNFFDYRKQFVQYPAYIGHVRAGDGVCYQISRNGGRNIA